MTMAVLLAFSDGSREFVADTHVHGFRQGHLLIASGVPGSGLDARVVRQVPVADLAYAETCDRDDQPESGSDWAMHWPDD